MRPVRKPVLCIQHLLLWACLTLWAATGHTLERGEKIEWMDVQTVRGQEIPASQLRGRFVFLQVWASWCPYCSLQNASLPAFQKRWETGGGSVLTLAGDRQLQPLMDYLDTRRYTFPVVHITPAIRSWLGKTRTVPTVFIIGPDGSVLKKIEGQMLEDDLLELVDLLPSPGGGNR